MTEQAPRRHQRDRPRQRLSERLAQREALKRIVVQGCISELVLSQYFVRFRTHTHTRRTNLTAIFRTGMQHRKQNRTTKTET